MQNTITDNYDDRIIKATKLNLRELLPIRRMKPDMVDLKGTEQRVWRVRPGTVVRIFQAPPPHCLWTLLIRGYAYSYRTEAEALAFLRGKYTNAPDSLTDSPRFPFDLQLHSETLPRDKDYYANPVVQHLKTGDRLGIHPWCVQYRGGGTYFSTFAELCAYIEGRWGRYIGDESEYA